jgi:rubredoxin
MKKWKCLICKYIHEGDAPPEKCPVCKAPAAKFAAVEPEISPREADAAKDVSEGAIRMDTSAAPVLPKKTTYGRIGDFLGRRHAHPISVHFPNGVLPVALMMFVLALLLDASTLATAGFYNLAFVMLALPFVIFTGRLDWERKYKKALTPIFRIKIIAAAVTFAACLTSLFWYLIDPGVIGSPQGWLFIIVNLIMVAAAGVAGHIGGKLVFKD